jgi:SpoIID/LytB domain protein
MNERRIAIVLFLATVVAVLPAGPAPAQEEFIFYGAGWGHGIGMSQWGAYGLALDGSTHEEILTHYYSGTSVGQAASPPSRIRVGLVQGKKQIHLEAVGGPVVLRVGGANKGPVVGQIPIGATWTVEINDGRYRVLRETGKLVKGKLWGGTDEHLFVRYSPLGSRVRVTEAGHTYNRGWIEFNIYGCDSCPGSLRLIASVRTQQYFYGIAEVPSSWPEEVLEAQAIAARTYAFEKVSRLGQNRDGCNCGVYGSTLDQVYAGWDKEGGTDGNRWVAAVDATAGKVIRYQGQYIQAFYHSSSGGFTENNENVWSGTPLGYLRGVCDPGDYVPANSNREWQMTLTGAAVGNKLAAATGNNIGDAVDFTGMVRGVSGRIVSVTVVGTSGEVTVSGAALRSALGLNDSKVWINQNRNITGVIRTRYDSLNCKPGIPTTPQVTVPGGIRQGFTNGGLYRNEALQATRWIHGPIYDKYVELGQEASLLGLPRSNIVKLPKLGGQKAQFEGGYIYFKEGPGAHELHGPVLDYFLSVGGPSGRLGFPTSDVTAAGGGATSATFEGGTVSCSPDGACSES